MKNEAGTVNFPSPDAIEDDLFQRITTLEDSIQGLTISGTEPLQQQRSLLALLERVRTQTLLSVLVFSGFTWEEIHYLPLGEPLLAHIDVLTPGCYNTSQRQTHGLIGPAKKTVHLLTGRYTLKDL